MRREDNFFKQKANINKTTNKYNWIQIRHRNVLMCRYTTKTKKGLRQENDIINIDTVNVVSIEYVHVHVNKVNSY